MWVSAIKYSSDMTSFALPMAVCAHCQDSISYRPQRSLEPSHGPGEVARHGFSEIYILGNLDIMSKLNFETCRLQRHKISSLIRQRLHSPHP